MFPIFILLKQILKVQLRNVELEIIHNERQCEFRQKTTGN